jgi:tRNA-Thr(GGU) m(6)t(6)A37 methyltransferase TsaA
MTANPSRDMDIRPGEIGAALPETFDAQLYFIGRIRTPWLTRPECPKNPRASQSVCTIEVEPRFAPALNGLETCSHVVVLYWMHQARRDLLLQRPRHHDAVRGAFALRSPVRPNPIALSVAALLDVNGTCLRVRGLDCLDGTPLLDLKPYLASIDAVPEAVVGWHADRAGK